MVQVNELRVGNLIIAALYKTPIIVEDISSTNEDIYNRDTGEIPIVSINPIEINSEWFIRFGFAFSGESVLFKDLFEVAMTKNKKFYLKGLAFTVLEIKYVHQLQNLHFCLTGEDLELPI